MKTRHLASSTLVLLGMTLYAGLKYSATNPMVIILLASSILVVYMDLTTDHQEAV